MAGTYSRSSPWYIGRSGSAGKYIVFKSYGGTATFKWTGGGGTLIAVTSGTHYVEVNGLTVDAQNKADSSINCNTADHVRIIGNTLMNGGAAGFSSYHCDYMVIDSNRVYHAGYSSGFSSAISVNENRWSDNAAGFHTVISRNIISGSYDASSWHADGNGIIVDTGGNIPPTLIVNNLVYENYYRCLATVNVQHVWEINNTCYKNGLRNNPSNDVAGEINQQGSTDVHVINNIVYAWTYPRPYKQIVELGRVPAQLGVRRNSERGPCLCSRRPESDSRGRPALRQPALRRSDQDRPVVECHAPLVRRFQLPATGGQPADQPGDRPSHGDRHDVGVERGNQRVHVVRSGGYAAAARQRVRPRRLRELRRAGDRAARQLSDAASVVSRTAAGASIRSRDARR